MSSRKLCSVGNNPQLTPRSAPSLSLDQAQQIEDLFMRAGALFASLEQFEPKVIEYEDGVALAALCAAGRQTYDDAAAIFIASGATRFQFQSEA